MKLRHGLPATGVTDEARRVLMDAIRQLNLTAYFSRAILKSAEQLAAKRQAWRKPLAWFQPHGSRANALQSEVSDKVGSACVTVYLYALFGETRLDTTCTCGQAQCVHAAALLIRLQQLLDWPRAISPLQRWQAGLNEEPDKPSASLPTPWLFACLLQATPLAGLRPHLLTVQLIAYSREDARGHPQRWTAAERARPHLSRQASAWLAQLLATQRRYRTDPTAPIHLLNGESGAHLLDEFLRAGICRHADTLQVLRQGAPRAAAWRWQHDDAGCATVSLDVPHDTKIVDLEGLLYLDEATGEVGPLTLSRVAWDRLMSMPPVPPSDVSRLAEQWPPHPLFANVPAPPAPPAIRQVVAPLQPVVVVGASLDVSTGEYAFYAHAWADYAGHRWPLANDAYANEVVLRTTEGYVGIERNVDVEVESHQILATVGLVPMGALENAGPLRPKPAPGALAYRTDRRGGYEAFSAFEAKLQSLRSAGYALEYDPELPFAVLAPRPPLRATLDKGQRQGMTLFELAADIDGDAVDMLPIIMQGVARRAFSLTPVIDEPNDAYWLAPIGSTRLLPLPLRQLREWLNPLVDLLDQHSSAYSSRLELSRSQAMALGDCLTQQGVPVEGSQAIDMASALTTLRHALATPDLIESPESFQGALRHYQLQGLHWLQALRRCGLGGVLADDMGLGKTVQIIAHLLLELESGRLHRPALVVAPTSLVFNWLDEVQRFAPSLHCLNLTGPGRTAFFGQLASAHIVVTSYALLPIDMPKLEPQEYTMLVLDEAQWIKNPVTQTARAVRRLRAQHRVAVTGTPLENHLGELWAHFDAVLPGYLGDYRAFQRSFRIPIERQQDDQRQAILRQRIAPFLLRRDKQTVAPELPPKIDTVLRIAMGERQRRLYESLRLAQSALVRQALASYTNERARIVVLSALLRLRQACCHPSLVKTGHDVRESAKLEALLGLVQSLREEGRHIVVFSQFTSMLALVAEALDEAKLPYALLTGDTADRSGPVRDFQSGAVPILLASLKAGGVGLNLTTADAIVHYDPWWNPAVERQAVDRAHRIGRDDPVLVFKLLCEDTIEEKIESMKAQKGDLAEAILSGIDTSRPLNAQDIRSLFNLPPEPQSSPIHRNLRHAH